MYKVKKKARSPEIKIVIVIIVILSKFRSIILLIEAATPVLALFMLYRVTKESPVTIVFIAPRRTRNSFLFKFPTTSLPITAACPLPKPGRKLHNGEAIIDAKIDFK